MWLDGGRLVCRAHHGFDLARQGYVNLTGGRHPGTADTAAMVIARAQFLARGHYRPIAERIAWLSVRHDVTGGGVVVDVAGGTGYYLAAMLDRLPHRAGICVDLSAPALRRAARAHPRAAALGADAWQRLPLASGSASTVSNVFAPRNAAEIERILRPDGVLITASPTPAHLRELIEPLGMITVDPQKAQRHAATFDRFRHLDTQTLAYQLSLDRRDVAALVGMGPSAIHLGVDALAARVNLLPRTTDVTVSVQVSVYGSPGKTS